MYCCLTLRVTSFQRLLLHSAGESFMAVKLQSPGSKVSSRLPGPESSLEKLIAKGFHRRLQKSLTLAEWYAGMFTHVSGTFSSFDETNHKSAVASSWVIYMSPLPKFWKHMSCLIEQDLSVQMACSLAWINLNRAGSQMDSLILV
jgi:hypothetical protein